MKVELVAGIMAGLLRASKVMVEVRMELVVEQMTELQAQ